MTTTVVAKWTMQVAAAMASALLVEAGLGQVVGVVVVEEAVEEAKAVARDLVVARTRGAPRHTCPENDSPLCHEALDPGKQSDGCQSTVAYQSMHHRNPREMDPAPQAHMTSQDD